MSSLTAEKTKELKLAFDLYDQKKTGKVTQEDFIKLLRAMGKTPNESEAKDIASKAKEFTFPKFVEAVEAPSDPITADQLLNGFKVCDENQTGSISLEELKTMLTTMGDKLSGEEVDEMLKGVKQNGGKVNIQEYVKFMTTPVGGN
eukprot:gb/GEZN01017606.1/.p1 GENE.gb/GEZN01017606.1/~~gb/GEZN01017606.1/.p1  ORF type:complete len:146 (+),score=29.91 gb/GEZN01017606.1/:139-576(+)